MRLHITIEHDADVHDAVVHDARTCDARCETAVPTARRDRGDDEARWEGIFAGIGCIADTGHEWDEDPAAWVRAQRRGEARVGA